MDEKATNYNPDADLSDSTLCQYDTSGDATNLENDVQSAAEDGLLGMSWTMIAIFGGVFCCHTHVVGTKGRKRRDVWF